MPIVGNIMMPWNKKNEKGQELQRGRYSSRWVTGLDLKRSGSEMAISGSINAIDIFWLIYNAKQIPQNHDTHAGAQTLRRLLLCTAWKPLTCSCNQQQIKKAEKLCKNTEKLNIFQMHQSSPIVYWSKPMYIIIWQYQRRELKIASALPHWR